MLTGGAGLTEGRSGGSCCGAGPAHLLGWRGAVASSPEWAGPRRKREEGEKEEACGSAGERACGPDRKRGGNEKRRSLFFFQMNFPIPFSNNFLILLSLNQTTQHINYNAPA